MLITCIAHHKDLVIARLNVIDSCQALAVEDEFFNGIKYGCMGGCLAWPFLVAIGGSEHQEMSSVLG